VVVEKNRVLFRNKWMMRKEFVKLMDLTICWTPRQLRQRTAENNTTIVQDWNSEALSFPWIYWLSESNAYVGMG